ncbi:hypothetical protein [Acidithiobacillus caldus]|uniref:hypothetical protein n=1 Tax=Acidithiobacillus caldus TaxID=33059 RepID=UPI001C065D2C|nr:hypothetical protein [Acidithiobacillus caldus]MBU2762335.1 hypothetical protein [Acidithiobacillus caldus]MBU2771832.1 hypothetical protein [Acidithiobacillus caldus]
MLKKLALLSTLTLLAGCSTLPANYHRSPAAAMPAAGASTASTASPPALSPSELASRPSAKGAGMVTHGVCSARLGQAQGYLRGLLATDSRLAKSCLSATPAAVCWENLASTAMQQQRGLLDLVQDSGSCPQLAFLRRSADAYFRAAGAVAQGCADTGTPRCLEGKAVQEASHRGQVLRQAIGVAQ